MISNIFNLDSSLTPKGDQSEAIAKLVDSINQGNQHQILMGTTGSGKTFSVANIIHRLGKPALIIAHNKTLAAQLFAEIRELFPNNAVGFFISYYDYYQPEAYLPSSDTYIEKDSSINDDIDKMRHEATRNLFERKDVIIIASVSCIYGLGSPETYAKEVVAIKQGADISRNAFLRKLIDIQYSRNDTALNRGTFRVRGDVVDILPSHQRDQAIRVEFFGDEIEDLSIIDALTGKVQKKIDALSIYPNSHYIAQRDNMKSIIREILHDLGIRLRELKSQNKLVEHQRLEQRTMHDVELMEQLGFCPGIENYSRYIVGSPPAAPPCTLLDYFPEDFLTIIDESHMTVPQIKGMYRGDYARKKNLVDYGFRLPAALDNRPLNFDEFMAKSGQILYVSATPGSFELEATGGRVTEQIIRPTGLVDPEITVIPAENQVDDLYGKLKKVVQRGGRALVTTLTKRMAEDLTNYYRDLGVKVSYLHSNIDSIERVEILRDLRKGHIDVIIGINLLREGLDLPEVALVAVLDADKEGFLRSRSALIQVVGRAARNSEGKVVFYAHRVTDAMQACIDETNRRRQKQLDHNRTHDITPQSIIKEIRPGLREIYGLASEDKSTPPELSNKLLKELNIRTTKDLDRVIRSKTKEMTRAAAELNFEKAAQIRDLLTSLKDMILSSSDEVT